MRFLAIAFLLSLMSSQLLAQNAPGTAVELLTTLSGHTKSIEQIAFSPSGHVVASSSRDLGESPREHDMSKAKAAELISAAFENVACQLSALELLEVIDWRQHRNHIRVC